MGNRKEYGRLPESEVEVMQVLWACQKELSRPEIEEKLNERGKEWDTSTVNSLLSRLKKKGCLEAKRDGKRYVYRPLVSEEDYLQEESRKLLFRLYHGKPVNFIAALVQGNEISPEELRELEDFLEAQKRR